MVSQQQSYFELNLVVHQYACVISQSLFTCKHLYVTLCNCVCLSGESCVSLSGFGSCDFSVTQSRGCRDAFIGESHLTLAFSDRIESWGLQKQEKTPSWSMEIKSDSSGNAWTAQCLQLLGVCQDDWLNLSVSQDLS